MLSGIYEHTIDDKGRVSLPARHRTDLGETLMLWPGFDGQINVYPVGTWERFAQNVAAQNQAHPDVRRLTRLVYTAFECQVDRQGRVLIPPLLRTRAQLDTNVIIQGVNDHLEIWSQDRWRAEEWERPDVEWSDIAKKLAELGLRM